MENLVTFCVYRHTSPNGKSYIGQTRDYKLRCRTHQSLKGGCTAFFSAIKKYGWDSFSHDIIMEGLSFEDANELEAFLIAEAGTIAPGGYNLRSGGDSSRHSAASRAKIGKANKGHVHSPEARAKMSKSGKGRIFSAEHRARIGMAQRGNQRGLGHKRTKEQCEKLSKALTGMKRTPEHAEKIAIQNRGRVKSPEEIAANTKARSITYELTSPKYSVSHLDGRTAFGNRKHLFSLCDLSAASMHELINKVRPCVKGWSLSEASSL